MPYPKDGVFLEIGTGCGVVTIEGIIFGKAKAAVAIDINPQAIENTILNAKKFNIE